METRVETPAPGQRTDQHPSRPLTWLVVGLLLLGQGFLLAAEIQADSPTYDEPAYVDGGYWLLQGKPKLKEHPPMMMLIYGVAARLFGPDRPVAENPEKAPWIFGRALTAARAANLVVTLLISLLVFVWARRVAGLPAGVAAVGIAAVDPTLLGLGHLAGLDVGAAATFALACYAGERLNDGPTPARFAAAGAAAGLAFLTKWSAVALIAALPAAAAVPSGQRHDRFRPVTRRVALQVLAVLTGIVLMLVVYVTFPGLSIRIFREGLAMQLNHARAGHESFLLGKVSCNPGFLYYPLTVLLKTPLPLLALAAAGAILLRRRPFVWVTALVYLGAFVVSTVKLGVRYVLPAYPMLYVMAGASVAVLWASRSRWGRPFAVTSLALLAVSSLLAFPNHLGYMNELSLASRWRGRDWLNDSNVDWGQGLKRLASDARKLGIDELCLDYFGPTWWYPETGSSPLSGPLSGVRLVSTGCRYAAVSSYYLLARPEHAPLRHRHPLNRGPIFIFDVSDNPSLARPAAPFPICSVKH